MASLRQRFSVAWAGGDDVEVLTTIRDVINAVDLVAGLDGIDAQNRVAAQTSIIWSALNRSGHSVGPYLEWLDQLDSYREVAGVDSTEGPTRPDRSRNGQSPSRSSPAPTGGAGSTKTPAPSKPRKRS